MRGDTIRRALRRIGIALITAAVVVATIYLLRQCSDTGASVTPTGADTAVFVDTVRVVMPVPRDSVVIRYETVTLPAITPLSTTEDVDSTAATIDSATVQIPITRHEYGDSTYHLTVSGYHVAVDEISVFPRREVVKIREPPKRWHIGVSVGYGYTPRGMQPYIGVSITHSILSF